MPAVVDTAAHLTRLEEDGYTIIEEVLSANEVAATRAAVTRLEQELGIEVAPATTSKGVAPSGFTICSSTGRAPRSFQSTRVCCRSSRACSIPVV